MEIIRKFNEKIEKFGDVDCSTQFLCMTMFVILKRVVKQQLIVV